MSSVKATADAQLAPMNGLSHFHNGLWRHKDFEDRKLPTLDNMEGGRIIHFEHYIKPMATNMVLQAKTALSVTVKAASLKEEVVRRFKHEA